MPGKPQPPKKSKSDDDPDNLFKDIAAKLSLLGGKIDPKTKAVIREPAPVMVAGGSDGELSIKLPGVISTRCHTLDAAIGRGGLPMARITTLTGGEGGGKTTLCHHAGAEVQTMGGVYIHVDNEHKLDLQYARSLGVNLQKMILTQPGTIEDSLGIINEAIPEIHRRNSDMPIFAVLDSINASKSEREYEEDGSADMMASNQAGLGAQARVMSDRLPKVARMLSGRRASLLMISQPRDNIGTPGQNLVAGGNAARYYSALIIQLIRLGFAKEGERNIGSMMLAKCIKNQVFRPFLEANFIMRWGLGVDTQRSLIDQAVKSLLISPGSAGWFEMEDPEAKGKMLKWQGAKGFHKLTTDKPYILDHMLNEIRKGYGWSEK